MSPRSTKISLTCASEGAKTIIFREGPKNWTRMLLWDTLTDTLTAGQWLHSKITNYGTNSDASLVLSFVQNYRNFNSPWVALSKPPWFTALAVWHIGDSYGGNCGFVTDNDLYIEKGFHDIVFEGDLKPGLRWSSDRPKEVPVPEGVNLIRTAEAVTYIKESKLTHFEIRHNYSSDKRVAYQFENGSPLEIKLPEDICDMKMDSQGRIIYTRRNGIIYRISRSPQGVSTEEVFNLSDMNPEPIVAPDHAIKW